MELLHHVNSVRSVINTEKAKGQRIAFVPTMGNLHDAHIELIRIAQKHADFVVSSIFVNRLQFGLNEDWDKYPRTLDVDAGKLREVGCDLLFCPDEKEIYPNGMDAQTRVVAPSMSDILCGASRPGHFEGVTTVVSKLFNIVTPDVAVFGIKDYQQLAIIRRMVEDLCFPVEIVAGEIVRESDGLAMSSRNGFITAQERPRVAVLAQSISWICERLIAGEKDFGKLEREALERIEASHFRGDYMSIRNSKTLAAAAHDDSQLTVLGAMYTEAARLIDNKTVDLVSAK